MPSSSKESRPYLTATLSQLDALNTSSKMLSVSDSLLSEFYAGLAEGALCMLPSFIYRLPAGTEKGTSVGLDLGGSTLRVAVISFDFGSVKYECKKEWTVGDDVKQLEADDFFDWVAERVREVVEEAATEEDEREEDQRVKPLGVSWSFPVTQTSLASGKIRTMGKGYAIYTKISGMDLGGYFQRAFDRKIKKHPVNMNSLVNDTEATLLTNAFKHPSTSHHLSLICGTGLNSAISLPVSDFPDSKIAGRPASWREAAERVLVNTEVSMFGGKGVFPITDADTKLDEAHRLPGFQPLEHLLSGRYLGEVVRLIVEGAVEKGELFGGKLPVGFSKPYEFGAPIAAALESELSVEEARELLQKKGVEGVEGITEGDVEWLRKVTRAVAERAATYLAVALFTLWRMQRKGLEVPVNEVVGVAYTGAVLEKHPTIRNRTQELLDLLVREDGEGRRLVLDEALDSGLVGAAIGALVNSIHEDSASLEDEESSETPA